MKALIWGSRESLDLCCMAGPGGLCMGWPQLSLSREGFVHINAVNLLAFLKYGAAYGVPMAPESILLHIRHESVEAAEARLLTPNPMCVQSRC